MRDVIIIITIIIIIIIIVIVIIIIIIVIIIIIFTTITIIVSSSSNTDLYDFLSPKHISALNKYQQAITIRLLHQFAWKLSSLQRVKKILRAPTERCVALHRHSAHPFRSSLLRLDRFNGCLEEENFGKQDVTAYLCTWTRTILAHATSSKGGHLDRNERLSPTRRTLSSLGYHIIVKYKKLVHE
ncbi:hypothetical protein E2C01_010323 [Portunus trituberculatus]|uniref:Uncharacterized protein n=1 Tax=Portunus trituberculatus TaxID=210409 RepID=A0A5B7D859_PORTR|nr:hypothetical protein [Portunus trituberculatus]